MKKYVSDFSLFLLVLLCLVVLYNCKKLEKEMMVSTGEVTNIMQNSAEASGTIVDLGKGVTEHGHCYAKAPDVSVGNLKTALGVPSGNGGFTSELENLDAGTKYYIKAYLSDGNEIVYGKEINFSTAAALLPVITTIAISDITQNAANSGGSISSDGGAPVTARGVCWSNSANPTLANNKTTDGTGTGSFASQLTGLTGTTTYYLRAYATNSTGTAYGNEVSFITAANAVVPPVATTAVTSITINTASSGGNISNDGGAPVTARGVCWNITVLPTIANSKTSNGTGTGSFTSSIAGLNPGNTYFVRAYATNSVGTGYGNELSFTTNSDIPTLTTTAITSITTTTASTGGNISSDGGATVTARGVCWSTTVNPTIANSKTTNGTGTGIFVSDLTGLNSATVYYVRAYATNSAGTAYGNQVSFTTTALIPTLTTTIITSITATTASSGGNISSDGGATVTARGVCWSTTNLPTIGNNITTNGTGTGNFISSLTGLSPASVYYVRAYATNNAGTAYGNELSFTTIAGIPTITTIAISSITETTAISGGNITSDGGAPVTARGVCLNTAASPTIDNSKTIDGSGTGAFISYLSGLIHGTTYYVRAYATNSYGTAYGDEVNFTASIVLPTLTSFAITNITSTTASSGGNITNDGGASVTARGVCWSTLANPTIANSKTNNGSGTGSFVSNLTGLIPEAVYYVRAYATNSVGTAYGNQVNFNTCGTVTDIDGNVYNTVTIGTQVWMNENLKTTKYNDGSAIPLVTDGTVWIALSTPAYCWYNNDTATYKATYGGLYNWYTVNTGKLCFTGWHVPTDAEWSTLITYLGGESVAGGKLKETGTTHWSNPNTGATNESGFTALPGGYRYYIDDYYGDGPFHNVGSSGYWWSATEGGASFAWRLRYNDSAVSYSSFSSERSGFSVRCVRN